MLTPRERQVLIYKSLGYTTKETAYYLGICIKTAEIHAMNLKHKLGVYRNFELTQYAVSKGMIKVNQKINYDLPLKLDYIF